MRVLYDSDVLLDVLLARRPHVGSSAAALERVATGTVDGYVAGHAVTNLYYLLRRQVGDKKTRALLAQLLSKLTVAPVSDNVIRSALVSDFADFEDAVAHAAAVEAGIDVIVTRNAGDFKPTLIPVL